MVNLPRSITLSLIVYIRFLQAGDDVCYTEYDVQETCHDCCYGTPLSTYNNITSAIACSELCSRNKQCRSMQYDPSTKDCWTNGEKMTTVNTSCSNIVRYGEIQLGSCRVNRMFEPCNIDGNCPIANSTCSNGKCECKDGHPYDYRFDSCPTECTKYGNTFHEVPYYIVYKNTAYYPDVSPDECIQKCLITTNFVCRFVEYEELANNCWLSEFTALTADSNPALGSDWRQWDRNCA